MNRFWKSCLRARLRAKLGATLVVAAGLLADGANATGATQYVFTNDDPGVSVYSVAPDGRLTLNQQLQIGGFGNEAGFFGTNRIAVLDSATQQCVYASAASTGEVVGIVVSTLSV